MIKQRIIPAKISITKQGEIKFFQVKIPFDARTLTGIETGIRLKSFADPGPPADNTNSLMGELKLQSSDDSNVFYATDISNPAVNEKLDLVPSVNFMEENIWTHGCKRRKEEIVVDGNTTVLAGIYKDRFGERIRIDVSYDVFLYVWYRFKSSC